MGLHAGVLVLWDFYMHFSEVDRGVNIVYPVSNALTVCTCFRSTKLKTEAIPHTCSVVDKQEDLCFYGSKLTSIYSLEEK